MTTKSFYGRNSTLVTTLEEVNDIVEAADHVLSVVVLPPEAGDSQSQDTKIQMVYLNLQVSWK